MSLDDTIEKLRAERIARRSFPNIQKTQKNINSGYYDIEDDIGDDIEKKLKELKKDEPSSDNIFRRLAIIGYEYGFVQRHLTYAEIFKEDKKERRIQLASARLELADLITQINMLCITMEWDLEELRKLGVQHLEERHEDFRRNKWRDVDE